MHQERGINFYTLLHCLTAFCVRTVEQGDSSCNTLRPAALNIQIYIPYAYFSFAVAYVPDTIFGTSWLLIAFFLLLICSAGPSDRAV